MHGALRINTHPVWNSFVIQCYLINTEICGGKTNWFPQHFQWKTWLMSMVGFLLAKRRKEREKKCRDVVTSTTTSPSEWQKDFVFFCNQLWYLTLHSVVPVLISSLLNTSHTHKSEIIVTSEYHHSSWLLKSMLPFCQCVPLPTFVWEYVCVYRGLGPTQSSMQRQVTAMYSCMKTSLQIAFDGCCPGFLHSWITYEQSQNYY